MKIVKIKNKSLRVLASAVASLAMIAAGVTIIGVLSYRAGYYIAQLLNAATLLDETPIIIVIFGLSMIGGIIGGVILIGVFVWVCYCLVKRLAMILYNGPFDP